jgi:ABC-type uncharacterized transport system permease subunit
MNRSALRIMVRDGVLFVSIAIATLVLLLLVTGYDPATSLQALFRGAFGSWFALTSATLVRAVPLALAGLAVALAFRAGLLNIGAEGQLLVGATATAAVLALVPAEAPRHLGIAVRLLALGAGTVAGGAWAGIAALLRQRFGVLEVISTIMLNFAAIYAIG